MASENTREIVLDMLLSIEREEEYSHRLVGQVLSKYGYLEAREKAFIKRLFEGTLERRIELDYRLDGISNVPTRKMKPLIRNLLRMSTYQLLYMDSVPDSAAVNEAVRLAGKRGFSNLKGFVNGVLRKFSADKATVKLPSEQENPKKFLSVSYSVPEWMAEHFLKIFSYDETKALLEGLLHIRPVMIRFVSGITDKEREDCIRRMEQTGVKVSRHAWVKEAWYLYNCENIALLPGFAQGLFTVQDASSVLAVAAAGIGRGDKVLDICAAPGGKALLAAEYAGPSGSVEARDISSRRMERIEENVKRMGFSNISLKLWDGTKRDEDAVETADVVLADVPCSGLGVMGRKRDIKYRQSGERMDALVCLQREILRQAADYVKPGGILLYSTCTINPKENEEQIDWLCEEFGFVREAVTDFLPADLPHADTAKQGFLQLLPNLHDTDGFFFARLKKPI